MPPDLMSAEEAERLCALSASCGFDQDSLTSRTLRTVVALRAENARLTSEVEEARLELAAERGEQAGAVSDLWKPELDWEGVVRWCRETPRGTVKLSGPRGWVGSPHDLDIDDPLWSAIDDMPTLPSARDMMRAADAIVDAALAEVPHG